MGEETVVEVRHLSAAELEAGLDLVRQSSKDGGTLALIVRRPAVDEREVLDEGLRRHATPRLPQNDHCAAGAGWRRISRATSSLSCAPSFCQCWMRA